MVVGVQVVGTGNQGSSHVTVVMSRNHYMVWSWYMEVVRRGGDHDSRSMVIGGRDHDSRGGMMDRGTLV